MDKQQLKSLADSLSLGTIGKTIAGVLKSFYFEGAEGIDRYAMHANSGSSAHYWTATDDGRLSISTTAALTDFPFELIPVNNLDGIKSLHLPTGTSHLYDLQGRS